MTTSAPSPSSPSSSSTPSASSTAATAAQEHWAALMGAGGAQDRAQGPIETADLAAPAGVSAVTGRGQVTLDWDPVPGAIGYAVLRAAADGSFEVVDHGGGDVLAVPHGPYADTTVTPGEAYRYAVAPLATVNAIGAMSDPVPVVAGGGDAAVEVVVRADGDDGALHRPWRAMVGSEHLTHLLCTDTSGGRPIGAELRDALRRVHVELGVASVRAHGILSGVLRDGALDFGAVDAVYDAVLELGMRPVVELSFMPPELARDPSQTVFAYEAVISPPGDWERWAWLVRSFTAHLIERYGREEVRNHWPFEVWNEANLSVFWSGTPEEYWRLYDVTAAAVREVEPGILVGGPGSAAVGWITEQLDRPSVDFLSTHVYGSPPLDLRPLAGGRPLLWTEWGVTATHGSDINDTVFAATFLLRGMHSAARRIDALAPWVASDHFEELGRPPRLLHGGFGLLTVGNLAKPKYWALRLLDRLGPTQLPVRLTGDGAGSLVECWASRDPSTGAVGVLLWNGTLDHGKASVAAPLDRSVVLRVEGLPATRHTLTQWRVDADHNNIAARWAALGGGDWPAPSQWSALAAGDVLEPSSTTLFESTVEVSLPMPSIVYLELTAGDEERR
ncbi:xylan 1,4-beta-xylosidase [Dactylosporangium sp. AC04546]|uniref:GH39 family glycosyl hydrolase n=1 Tax=Dactylosporangium sp. AC04546 TaxID=2862460 RepID=UPI001EDF2A82|nr:xylan 1,4-beta-xylosidase [Dactylosporangium sp. AC04546]WVK87374.1 xylan 1,4-beta-xylosidase [Dactylosporangium sp. AC04546]